MKPEEKKSLEAAVRARIANNSGLAAGGSVPAAQVAFNAVIIRCGCSEDRKLERDWHGNLQPAQSCPNPAGLEDRGTIAYYNKNLLLRILYKIKRFLRPNSDMWAGKVKQDEV